MDRGSTRHADQKKHCPVAGELIGDIQKRNIRYIITLRDVCVYRRPSISEIEWGSQKNTTHIFKIGPVFFFYKKTTHLVNFHM